MDLSRTPYNEFSRFPQLTPRYNGMPRRYEETKPVIIQDFTHRKIVGIGHDIQRRLLDRFEAEKREAIEIAEKAVWEKAEKKKHSAIKKTREEGEKKTEKALEQQKKEFEQQLKEEILRVEMAMQKQAVEEVLEERANCEKRLSETIELIQQRCAEELRDSVEAAREEERIIAAKHLENLQQQHKHVMIELQKEMRIEASERLATLEEKKNTHCKQAVKEAQYRVKKEWENKLEELEKQHDETRIKEAATLQGLMKDLIAVHRHMAELETQRDRLVEYLNKTRFWFQDFIDRVQKVKKGQADFLLPPAYIEEIEKGLMETEP